MNKGLIFEKRKEREEISECRNLRENIIRVMAANSSKIDDALLVSKSGRRVPYAPKKELEFEDVLNKNGAIINRHETSRKGIVY